MHDIARSRISDQQHIIQMLQGRGLPTHMLTTLLDKLIADRDAVAARSFALDHTADAAEGD
jgi:hypothetical protein